jgi:hypothetical protein
MDPRDDRRSCRKARLVEPDPLVSGAAAVAPYEADLRPPRSACAACGSSPPDRIPSHWRARSRMPGAQRPRSVAPDCVQRIGPGGGARTRVCGADRDAARQASSAAPAGGPSGPCGAWAPRMKTHKGDSH